MLSVNLMKNKNVKFVLDNALALSYDLTIKKLLN